MNSQRPAILDCHQHFFDARRFRHPVFETRSPSFEALFGDYSSLPRVYLPEDYARDTEGLNVVNTVWAEFMSDDPAGEVRWANELADVTGRPNGMIARVDFLDPGLNRVLEDYASLRHARCVRQHLGWHPTNPALRFADRPDFLSDNVWRKGIAALRGRGLVCELEIFSPQLPDLISVVASYADIQFVLPAMGWPLDLTDDGHNSWRHALTALSAHSNVAAKIFAIECIFGLCWTVPQVRPWILETIETFGPARCMFASHMPLCTMACSVQQLYQAYFDIIADFSASEKSQLLHDTAAKIYRIPGC
jgi:predicted TIM-barrel fold metal-dependent hydrolase